MTTVIFNKTPEDTELMGIFLVAVAKAGGSARVVDCTDHWKIEVNE